MKIEFDRQEDSGLTFSQLRKGKLYKSLSTEPQKFNDYTREKDVLFAVTSRNVLVFFNKKTGDWGPCPKDSISREPYLEVPTGTSVTLTSK